MNGKYTVIAVLAVLAFAIVPMAVDDADAEAYIDNGDVKYDFDNMDGGYITFNVDNTQGGRFTMDAEVREGGRTVATLSGVGIPAGEVTEVTVNMGDFKSVGTHTLTVVCTPAGEFPSGQNTFTLTVEVEKNLLSNWVTYAVIIIVVIVIAIFAYLKIRDSPKKKSEMTFEELEAQRKAEMAAKSEKRQKKEKPETVRTERKKYTGGSKDSEAPAKEPKPQKEKAKPTFEELEAQKKAEKAAKSEKKSTGLSERERYLEEKRKKKGE